MLCCLKCGPVDKDSRKENRRESCDVLPGSEAASRPCFLLAVAKQACWQCRVGGLSRFSGLWVRSTALCVV